ncbi:HAD family hydrolase [Dehalococcoides mccartyi]|nr:HAD family hydrolase [Dehalococcoides mccartyi]
MTKIIWDTNHEYVSAVTLDLYNTLLVADIRTDHTALSAEIFSTSLRNDGIELTVEAAAGLFSTRINRSLDDGMTYFERRISTFLASLGLDVSEPSIRQYATDILHSWDSRWNLANDAIQVISTLKQNGIAVGVVTNFDHYPYIRKLLERLKLELLSDAIVVSSEIKADKPDVRIFAHALSLLRVPAERLVHVGDDEVDVDGATNAGIRSVRISHYGSHSTKREYEDVPTIGSLSELLPLVTS